MNRWIMLGDLLGPLTYLGACARCRAQFMSTHVWVWHSCETGALCWHCARRAGKGGPF